MIQNIFYLLDISIRTNFLGQFQHSLGVYRVYNICNNCTFNSIQVFILFFFFFFFFCVCVFYSRYLYDNQLSGIIPTQLGNLTNLQYLYSKLFISFFSTDNSKYLVFYILDTSIGINFLGQFQHNLGA